MLTNRERFKSIKSYAVYYGVGQEQRLSKFDVVIVEPKGQNGDNIKAIQKEGTLVIAYVSVMEIHEYDYYYKFLKEEDFLKINNKNVFNGQYNSILIDLESTRWTSLFIHHIGNLILNCGYNGIFLDTIGDVEYSSIPLDKQKILINAAAKLVEKIRKLFNHCIIIQNNGLEKLLDHTEKLIDGVCWENPPIAQKHSSIWLENVKQKLKYIEEKEKLKVMLLIEENVSRNLEYYHKLDYLEIANKFAEEEGVILYYAPYQYLQI